jgi:hypothetical protein
MGQEICYRYQETLIVEMLYGLRKFRGNLEGRSRAGANEPVQIEH